MNDNLRQAMLRARLREHDVAASLGVDPKTVRRWIEGRVPHPVNRVALADLLRENEADLWPTINGPLAPRTARPEELVAVYPHRWAIPRETWVRFFASAEHTIDILAYSALFLAEDAGLLDIIADRGRDGVRVRIALGAPESESVSNRGREESIGDSMAAKARNALMLFRPLIAGATIEIRTHRVTLYNSIYRSDDQLMVNHHAFSIHATNAPVLYLSRTLGSDMPNMYLESFEKVWRSAQKA